MKVENHVETFPDQVHVSYAPMAKLKPIKSSRLTISNQGWMAARYATVLPFRWNITDRYDSGDLKDEKVRKEYERGYKILLDF